MWMDVNLQFFSEIELENCLPYILAVRNLTSQLLICMDYQYMPNLDNCGYQKVNDFLKAVNATKCYWESSESTLQLFENCPYTHEMDSMHVAFDNRSKWENIVLPHRKGDYENPPVSTVIRTIEEVCYGSANLDWHRYELRNEKHFAFLKYFFDNYDKYDEYFREEKADKAFAPHYGILRNDTIIRFVTLPMKDNIMMRVLTRRYYMILSTTVMIGKKDIVAEELKYLREYEMIEDCEASSDWWRMETAVEPEEGGDEQEETAACDYSD